MVTHITAGSSSPLISLNGITGSSPAAEKEENRLGLDANAETPLTHPNKLMRQLFTQRPCFLHFLFRK